MAQCPDCDGVKITPGINEGDGNCSVCHGVGKTLMDALVESIGGEAECEACNGSGTCPTCEGTGEVD